MNKFLKPKGKQFEITDLEFKGHNVVIGPAGSGKSVCAILRAKAIVNRVNEKVILLSYNNTLVNYLKNNVEDIENIKTITFHKLVTSYLRTIGKLDKNEILSNKEYFIKKAIGYVKSVEGNVSTLERERFIIEEIGWIEKVGCLTFKEYEHIARFGRGKARIEKSNRKYVFKVYEKYIKLREKQGYKYDWDDIAYYANKYIGENKTSVEEKHIIIDEGQDFSPTMIRFLVNYVGENGTIMYFGDLGQQIYGSNGTWKSSGLLVKKVYKLNQNYRNTIEIERLGNELRLNMKLDEQEGLISQNSSVSGEVPCVFKVENAGEEMKFMLSKISELSVSKSLAIMTINNDIKDEVRDELNIRGIEHSIIDREEKNFKGQCGIYLGTYHSLKGLEFDNVILFKCSNSDFELDKDLLKDDIETLEYRALKLLYVGVTRAKERIIFIHSGEMVNVFPKNRILSDGKDLFKSFKVSY